MNAFELDRFVVKELRALPTPRAPVTLLPRVLAAARAWAGRPWYAREWFTWPLGWQISSVALLVIVAAAGFDLIRALRLLLAQAAAPHAAVIAGAGASVAGRLEVSINVFLVIWRGLIEPFLPYAFAIVMLMCVACATVVVALNRLIFGRVLQS